MVRVAVVGCGYWGPNLIRNLYHLNGCELAMCCDADSERLAAFEQQYPALQTTTRFEDVMDRNDIEAVVIATPARTHFNLASQALTAGKHVMVEKPLAMASAECEDLMQLADRKRLVLMVGHTFLYNPALLTMKELSTPDYIGDLFYLYSNRVNLGRVQTDVNALWSIAPHDISIAQFLIGQIPEKVSAQGGQYLSNQIEDVVFITMTYPGGVVAHIHVSWMDPTKTRKVTLVGSEKMIVYDDLADEGMVKVYDKGVRKVPAEGNAGYGQFQLHSGDVYLPYIKMSEPLANECRHFIECIREGKRPRSDGENGLRVVQILEASQRSLELGGTPVPIAGERLLLSGVAADN